MLTITRTDSRDADFCRLVKLLDAELAALDGDEHEFYHQLNSSDAIKNVIVLHDDGHAVGCGAFRPFGENVAEIKRMYIVRDRRNSGLATKILLALEAWAEESGIETCILETGKRQPDAIRLYTKNGYKQTPNFGKYIGIDNSVCFQKMLSGVQRGRETDGIPVGNS